MGQSSRKGNCTQAERHGGAHPLKSHQGRARASVNRIYPFMKRLEGRGWLGSQLRDAIAKQGTQWISCWGGPACVRERGQRVGDGSKRCSCEQGRWQSPAASGTIDCSSAERTTCASLSQTPSHGVPLPLIWPAPLVSDKSVPAVRRTSSVLGELGGVVVVGHPYPYKAINLTERPPAKCRWGFTGSQADATCLIQPGCT